MALHHHITLLTLPQPHWDPHEASPLAWCVSLTLLLPLPGWPTLHPVLVAGHTAVLVSSLSRLQERAMPQMPAPARESPPVTFDLGH